MGALQAEGKLGSCWRGARGCIAEGGGLPVDSYPSGPPGTESSRTPPGQQTPTLPASADPWRSHYVRMHAEALGMRATEPYMYHAQSFSTGLQANLHRPPAAPVPVGAVPAGHDRTVQLDSQSYVLSGQAPGGRTSVPTMPAAHQQGYGSAGVCASPAGLRLPHTSAGFQSFGTSSPNTPQCFGSPYFHSNALASPSSAAGSNAGFVDASALRLPTMVYATANYA